MLCCLALLCDALRGPSYLKQRPVLLCCAELCVLFFSVPRSTNLISYLYCRAMRCVALRCIPNFCEENP